MLDILRQSVRSLARRPALAAAAVLTLALCIGANTAIFSVVNAVLLEALGRLPGISVAGVTSRLPLHDPPSSTALTIDETAVAPPAQRPRVGVQWVSGSYFRAVGIPLRSGRDFDERDAGADVRTVVVNEAFTRQFLSGRAAVGARLRFGAAAEPGPAHTVIGVVGDTRDGRLREKASPQVFFDYRQSTPAELSLVVRAPTLVGLAPALRREVTAIDPLVPTLEPIPLGRVLADATAADRFMSLLVGAFAGLSLLLAGVGVYGTMAESVASRTREMGVRLALGARPADVRGLILREAGVVVGGALLVGIPLAWAAARAMRGLLYEVSVADPATYAVAIAVATSAALAACCVPARRASRVDPVVSLKGE
jgi:putative ABC transport system permease protein